MRYGWDMHFPTSLFIVVGFAILVCLGLVKMIRELSQLSVHESPAIRETPSELAAVKDVPEAAVESRESSSEGLSDTCC
jgi:hypothetical protein